MIGGTGRKRSAAVLLEVLQLNAKETATSIHSKWMKLNTIIISIDDEVILLCFNTSKWDWFGVGCLLGLLTQQPSGIRREMGSNDEGW
jgi:hypothetical protein